MPENRGNSLPLSGLNSITFPSNLSIETAGAPTEFAMFRFQLMLDPIVIVVRHRYRCPGLALANNLIDSRQIFLIDEFPNHPMKRLNLGLSFRISLAVVPDPELQNPPCAKLIDFDFFPFEFF